MSVYTASADPPEGRPLPQHSLLYYGLPGLVTAIPTIPVFILVPGFYAGNLGLGLAVTGLVLFLSRSVDLRARYCLAY